MMAILSCLLALADPPTSAMPGLKAAELRKAASRGDKAAALALGKMYEAGTGGVPRDLRSARRWYREAARDVRVRRLVYSAPVGSEKFGRAIDVGSGERIPGLIEARQRLKRLDDAKKQGR